MKRNRFELLSHTADLGLVITTETIEEMLKQAGNGLLFLLIEPEKVRSTQRYEFEVVFSSLENLLVRFLNKLIFAFDADGILLKDFEISIAYGNSEEGVGKELSNLSADFGMREDEGTASSLGDFDKCEGEGLESSSADFSKVAVEGIARIVAFGEAIDPTHHHFKHLVKAATYGGLNVSHQDGEYKATVILDD